MGTMTKVQERAALMVAQDQKTDEAIAKALGIGRRTLATWKALPVFSGRVQEHRDAWRAEIKAQGITDRKARVAALEDRWQRMKRVIDERAAEMGEVDEATGKPRIPGGASGLLVRTYKQIGGKEGQMVEEYAVDTGLLREMREHEKQAAQELGQLPAVAEDPKNEGVLLEDLLMFWQRAREVREPEERAKCSER